MQHALNVHVPRPFVKWAGGKRQMLPLLHNVFPAKYGAYHEPFVGGGAVLFHMLSTGRPVRYRVSDLNSDLILTYLTVRDRVEDLIESLKAHKASFVEDPKQYYYAVRAQMPRGQLAKASRLIFLNRTCFNGLYRVNSRGMFNVPMGSYVNPKIVDETNLRAASAALQEGDVTLECSDFESVLGHAEPGDMVYLDPPYHPISKAGNFTGYTRNDFSHRDLVRLAAVCNRLDQAGCHVILSNSHAAEVVSQFTDGPWNIMEVTASRNINSDGRNRTGHKEVVITNHAARRLDAVV